MTGVNFPEDPAPNGYQENPYDSQLDAAQQYLHTESVSTDGWQNIGTKADVVMEKKQMPGDGSAIPLVRGRGIIKGVRPSQLYPIISQPSARVHWDARFQEAHPLRRYARRSYKFYSLQKGGFLVSPRDILGAQGASVSDDGTIEVFQTSVPNDDDAPEQSGRVRANLTLAGWALRPSGEEDTDATYIVKIDPKGSLPTTIINHVVSEIPLCVVNVAEFFKSNGLISYIVQEEIGSVVRFETYEHDKHKYTSGFIGKAGDAFDIFVDNNVMYKGGYSAALEGDSSGVEITQEATKVHVKVGDEADGKKFTITLTRS